MKENSFENAMNMMLGHSPQAINAYFGKAALAFPGLSVYVTKGGCIAVVFSPNQNHKMTMEAIGYAVYDRSGRVLCANGIQLVSMDAADLKAETDISTIAEKYGSPHLDTGSGMTAFAYLSDHATLYSVQMLSMKMCMVRERSLVAKEMA